MSTRFPRLRYALAVTLLSSLLGHAAAPTPAVPILAGSGGDVAYLLGAWAGGRWLADHAAVPQLEPATRYRSWSLGKAVTSARGARPTSLGEPCDATLGTELHLPGPEGALRLYLPERVQAAPRPVEVLPTANPAYAEVVRAELRRRGIARPQVQLTRLVRADLDGDGTQEVLIEARHFQGEAQQGSALYPPPTGQPGDYSVLLLRSVWNGQAVTSTLGAYLGPARRWDPESSAPMPLATLYRLVDVADVNGDGRMELVTYSAYYEGSGFGVYEWTPRQGAQLRLETGCGV
ncbi:hypothetical protein [Deinococcus sonorensis]|uniref:Uncharacterized protein n=2 Tax=Deinococcus sonorensis TaxID=309891 RepID=A0AAU7UFX7_9DEIO